MVRAIVVDSVNAWSMPWEPLYARVPYVGCLPLYGVAQDAARRGWGRGSHTLQLCSLGLSRYWKARRLGPFRSSGSVPTRSTSTNRPG